MTYQGIEFNEMELMGLKGFLLDSTGGSLLGKILMDVREEGYEGIRDAGAPIERLRYCQGLLDGLDRFQSIAQRIAAIDPLEYKDEDENMEDEDEEAVDVRY